MDRELVVERLKSETEVLKLLVLLWLALGGGSLSLVAGGLTGMRLLLAGLGLSITVVILRRRMSLMDILNMTPAEWIAVGIGGSIFASAGFFAWKIASYR